MLDQEKLSQNDDSDLAHRINGGDQNALRVAIAKYGPKVKGFLRKQFSDQFDQSDLDNVFQKSLIKFWEGIEKYEPNKGSLRGWWIRIARNAAIDHIRGESRHKTNSLCDPAFDENENCGDVEFVEDSRERKRLDRVYDFIRNRLVGDERFIALNCFAIGGDPDTLRLTESLGKQRSYVDTVKSKVKRKILDYVRSLEDEDGRKDGK